MISLVSCDTFVVLPPVTGHGGIVFGKNSDRPNGEVQELIYRQEEQHAPGTKLKCTYIEVEQVSTTFSVVLSKPAWMWGAEMGANSQGVVIGNEAVWTKVPDEDGDKLLGMDLVRLGLERASSACQAVTCITQLLEKYGQAGSCSDSLKNFTYHNSFLIADRIEAWVLETAGRLWAAERVTAGCRNISNGLSIGTRMDLCSMDLQAQAQKLGLWDGVSDFNFAAVFSTEDAPERYTAGAKRLQELSADSNFDVLKMFQVLRDDESGICRGCDDGFPTTASQVSLLSAAGSDKPSCHWFTATPDPRISVFKPFIFTAAPRVSLLTESPTDTVKDRAHALYKLHADATTGLNKDAILSLLRNMEMGCVAEVNKFLADFTQDTDLSEVDDLLKDVVEAEIKFYK